MEFKANPPIREFIFNGQAYPYCTGGYNSAAKNDRAIEVPIGSRFLQEHRGKRILEVGNVMKHYQPIVHFVLDKYESGPGIIRGDVVDFDAEPFDAILSISTMEHVGFE